MNTRHWIQLAIRIDEQYQDLLSGLLVPLGFSGFVQEDNMLKGILPQHKWTPLLRSKVESALANFRREFPSLDLSYRKTIVREQNWNRKWEKQTGIVEATHRIIIKPSWKKLPARYKNSIVLHIDPKMSFGTGHHETTRLSLGLIERFIKPDMNVLDFGTGTGVLAIACIRLGAKSVSAVDTDEWSIENAKENVKRNRVQKQIFVIQGSVSAIPRRKYELIVANIDYKTIARFLSSLSKHLSNQGILIFSGILTDDLPSLRRMFAEHRLALVECVHENEWSSVVLRRIHV